MFEDATFESYGRIHTRSRNWMLATFALNGGVLAALVLFPLLHPEALRREFQSAPLVFQQEPQPLPVHVRETQASEQASMTEINRTFEAPRLARSRMDLNADATAPGSSTVDSLGEGIGSPSGADVFRRGGPLPVVRMAPRGSVRLPSKLVEGMLVRKTIPIYPPIARAIHVQGTVVLQATISTAGRIEGLRVVSGPPLLQAAAVNAVKTWIYRPYILNGKPVEVETTVNVQFRME